MKREGHRVQLRFDPERIPAADLIARITAAHAISDLFVENPPIEEIIARIYGDARQ
jgi:ABC-2 type transport system ATP-binding protein